MNHGFFFSVGSGYDVVLSCGTVVFSGWLCEGVGEKLPFLLLGKRNFAERAGNLVGCKFYCCCCVHVRFVSVFISICAWLECDYFSQFRVF